MLCHSNVHFIVLGRVRVTSASFRLSIFMRLFASCLPQFRSPLNNVAFGSFIILDLSLNPRSSTYLHLVPCSGARQRCTNDIPLKVKKRPQILTDLLPVSLVLCEEIHQTSLLHLQNFYQPFHPYRIRNHLRASPNLEK